MRSHFAAEAEGVPETGIQMGILLKADALLSAFIPISAVDFPWHSKVKPSAPEPEEPHTHLFSDPIGRLSPLLPFDAPFEKKLHAVSGLPPRAFPPAESSWPVRLPPSASTPKGTTLLQSAPLAVAGRLGDWREDRCGGARRSSRLPRHRGEEKQRLDVFVAAPLKPRLPGQSCKLRGALTPMRVGPPPEGCLKSGDVSAATAGERCIGWLAVLLSDTRSWYPLSEIPSVPPLCEALLPGPGPASSVSDCWTISEPCPDGAGDKSG